jgi:para-aminobenzoate synthetase component I
VVALREPLAPGYFFVVGVNVMSSEMPSLPLIEELPATLKPETALSRMARLPHCLFLDSALTHPSLGRYSFLAADPFDFVQYPADGSDALKSLDERLRQFWCHCEADRNVRVPCEADRNVCPPCRTGLPHRTGLPPFQGGAAGLFGYDLGRSLERLPMPRTDEFAVPALAVGFYDVVVAFDHAVGRAWIISQGFPETGDRARHSRAQHRLEEVRGWLSETTFPATAVAGRFQDRDRLLASGALSPQFPVPGTPGVTSNFSKEGYLEAVRRVIDYIYAGDVFQVNLSQRLLVPARDDSVALYHRLRRCNPATFAGYFDLGDFQIISASPERFLRVTGREVETRPIKGTRPRTGETAVDRAAEADLLASEKDRAENVMIVDLMRNDLARVCEPSSVCVGQLCGVETYQHVLHLVSSVHGRLREGRSPVDLLRAAFPGGSVTGAPKIRAMEIIAELEPTARGPYCGSLGYVGFDGSMDLSILIRTITAGRGWWQFPVGGGIVADSVPEKEYEETWHKAEGLLRAI